MALKGEINLVRTLADHPLWQGDLALRGAWVDLLLRANTDNAELIQRGENVSLKRGQLAWSIKGLAEKWNCCEEKATKYLSYLQKIGCIRVKTSNRRTVITISNYEVYQSPSLENNDTDTAPGSVPDSEPSVAPDSVTESVTGPVAAPVQSREKRDRRHTHTARGACPDWAEVEAFAVASGVDREFALDWFQRKVNSLSHGFATLLDWRADLMPYWRRNGGASKPEGSSGVATNGARPKTMGAEIMALKGRRDTLASELSQHPANPESTAAETTLGDDDLANWRDLNRKLANVEAQLRSIPKDAPEEWQRRLRREAFQRELASHPGNPDSTAFDEQSVDEKTRREFIALRKEAGL